MRTLLISLGGERYPSAPDLRHPAFGPSSRTLAALLKDGEWRAVTGDDHLDLFDDDRSWPDQLLAIRTWLATREDADGRLAPQRPYPDNLIIHYVGHGWFRANSEEHLLTINHTDAEERAATSLAVGQLNTMLLNNVGQMRRYYLIDACFAAASARNLMADTEEAIEYPLGALLHAWPESGQGTRGVAALCSADNIATADARGERSLTQFTDGLLDVLEHGDIAVRTDLSLRRLSELLKLVLRQRYGERAVHPVLVAPEDQHGGIAGIAMFPNLASRRIDAARSSHEPADRQAIDCEAEALVASFAASHDDIQRFEEARNAITALGTSTLPARRGESSGSDPVRDLRADLADDLETLFEIQGRGVDEIADWAYSHIGALQSEAAYLDPFGLASEKDVPPDPLGTLLRRQLLLDAVHRGLRKLETGLRAIEPHSLLLESPPSRLAERHLRDIMTQVRIEAGVAVGGPAQISATQDETLSDAASAASILGDLAAQLQHGVAARFSGDSLSSAVRTAVAALRSDHPATTSDGVVPQRPIPRDPIARSDLIPPAKAVIEPREDEGGRSQQDLAMAANEDQEFGQAVYRFFRLTQSKKAEIVGDMKIRAPDDALLPELDAFKKALARARDQGKTTMLVRMIKEAEGRG